MKNNFTNKEDNSKNDINLTKNHFKNSGNLSSTSLNSPATPYRSRFGCASRKTSVLELANNSDTGEENKKELYEIQKKKVDEDDLRDLAEQVKAIQRESTLKLNRLVSDNKLQEYDENYQKDQ